MKIAFVLPGFSSKPIGGFAVVYEYANRLAARGHTVTLVHPRVWLPDGRALGAFRAHVRGFARDMLRPRVLNGRPGWFLLSEDVSSLIAGSNVQARIPAGDATIATSWATAGLVARSPPNRGVRMQLVQHYETWAGPKQRVDASWQLPLHKIVISPWLLEVARALGVEQATTLIPNGIDTAKFRTLTPPQERDGNHVGMLYHRAKWKGAREGIQVLHEVRRHVPGLRATLFGTVRRPPSLPAWIDYVESPHGDELVRLYNEFAIFLHTSQEEGWGLPAMEAMACGCALVSVANSGVTTFALDGESALMAPVGDWDALGHQLVTVITDSSLRTTLARAGIEGVRRFSWDRSVDALIKLVERLREDQTAA